MMIILYFSGKQIDPVFSQLFALRIMFYIFFTSAYSGAICEADPFC